MQRMMAALAIVSIVTSVLFGAAFAGDVRAFEKHVQSARLDWTQRSADAPHAMSDSASGYWDDRFGPPGFYKVQSVKAGQDGALYAAFFYAPWPDNEGDTYVARWDGEAWSVLGSRISIHGELAQSLVLEADASGNVYAAGDFQYVDGLETKHIARWNGWAWEHLGSGIDNAEYPDYTSVNALALSNGNLYVGGFFTHAGGVAASNIAMWNGSTWSTVGSGLDGTVLALSTDAEGNLYAGGFFEHAGNVSAHRVAKWDGQRWSSLGRGIRIAGNGYDYSSVSALAYSNGNLYAGGIFTVAGEDSARNIARWDGTSWHSLGSGMSHPEDPYGYSPVNSLAIDVDGNLLAGGQFTAAGGVPAHRIAKWDGTSWSSLGSGFDGQYDAVTSLAVFPDGKVRASGEFSRAGDANAFNIAEWNGGQWAALGKGTDGGDVACFASAPGGILYAGGALSSVGGTAAARIAMWDGVGWSPLGSGMDEPVAALANDSNGILYAGGEFFYAGGIEVEHIARWDGTQWSSLGSGMNGSVRALAVDGSGNLYAGGDFTTAGGVRAVHVAKWNGMTWSAIGQGIDGPINALAIDVNGNVYAGGSGVFRWDGTAWSPLLADVYTYAMATNQEGDLYIGGRRIMKWNGLDWTDVSPEFGDNHSSVLALATDSRDHLYAGGTFSGIGDYLLHVAEWDGASWRSLGFGTAGAVRALAPTGNDLYVGGSFGAAGGRFSSSIALWHSTQTTAVSSSNRIPLTSVTPNPSYGSIRVDLMLKAPADVRITLIDVQGRNLATIARRRMTRGRHQIDWNGASLGTPTMPGIYFVHVRAGDLDQVHRVVMLK